jgi:CheY-like chemotaxis protein
VSENGPILLAEDNPDDALLFELAFRKAGLSNPIYTVSDGDLAIEYLKGEGAHQDRTRFPIPRLLIVDLKMQRVGGFEVLAWVRKSPQWRCLPVIVLTTSYYGPDIKAAYELGANSFLTKPNEFNDFVMTVKQMGDYWLRKSTLPGWEGFPVPSQQPVDPTQAGGGAL